MDKSLIPPLLSLIFRLEIQCKLGLGRLMHIVLQCPHVLFGHLCFPHSTPPVRVLLPGRPACYAHATKNCAYCLFVCFFFSFLFFFPAFGTSELVFSGCYQVSVRRCFCLGVIGLRYGVGSDCSFCHRAQDGLVTTLMMMLRCT